MIPKSKGTYILVLELTESLTLTVGKAGDFRLPSGLYFYVGSAQGPGGLAARIGRHFRLEKAHRWHIDYLRARAVVNGVFLKESNQRLECRWSAWMAQRDVQQYGGFGASDCRCRSHLFSVPNFETFNGLRQEIGQKLGVGFISARNTNSKTP